MDTMRQTFHWILYHDDPSRKQKRRAEARINKILVDQVQRIRLINSFIGSLATKKWKELLEGGTDTEVQWSASARSVRRAVEICCLAHESNVPMKWINGSIDGAEVNVAFENNRYWYEFMEDEQLMVELPVFGFFIWTGANWFFGWSQGPMETVVRRPIRSQGYHEEDTIALWSRREFLHVPKGTRAEADFRHQFMKESKLTVSMLILLYLIYCK